MASHKPKVLSLCKEVASDCGWQFSAGKFVQKVSKEAHFIIDPSLNFKGAYARFMINVDLQLPKIIKMVNSVSHLNQSIGFKVTASVSEQLNSVNFDTLMGERAFVFVGDDATSDELMAQEMRRWLQVAGDYLIDTWPVEDFAALFEAMQQSKACYAGFYGTGLCCLAAYLGKFDFIDRYYAGELPYTEGGFKDATDENLLAVLPDWQAQWQATGKIKV